jgi:zinc protease
MITSRAIALSCFMGALAPGVELGAQQRLRLEERLPTDPAVTVGALPNGIRYYIRVNRRPERRAELRLVVNAGSVLEDDDQRGLAHFVEHMAFNGTEHFPQQELVDYLETVGMRFGPDINAFTSFDETVYTLQVPTDSAVILRTGFRILGDWAHRQTFDPAEVEKERGVLIEEWRSGRGAEARIVDKQVPVLFKGSRYAERMPIGTRASLQSATRESLVRFYRDWYRPDLMAVVAVGDFDSEWVEELIRSHFAHIAPVSAPRARTVFPVPDHNETLFAIATDPEVTTTDVQVYYKQPLREFQTVGSYRQRIVERLYNSMLNARLFELTQDADPPFLFASSGQGRFIRAKEVYTLGASVPDTGVERGIAALLTEAERVARHGFVLSEMERHKVQLLRRMERAYAEREKTNSASYAFDYQDAFLLGDPIPGTALEHELTQRFVPDIGVEEVNRLAREWLDDRNRVILVSAPDRADVSVPGEGRLLRVFAAVLEQEIGPYTDDASSAPLVEIEPTAGVIVANQEINEVGITVWQLSNGVRVILKPTDFKDDEVLFAASSPGGTSLADDADFVAALTAASVVGNGGAGALSLVDLQKKLAGKAVRVGPTIGPLYEGFSGAASPADLETLFQLIYLYATAPRRDAAAFASFKKRLQALLANRDADPMAAFQDTLTAVLSQHHFRSRPSTPQLYEEMDLDKSLAFYRDRFADFGDFTFVFVGAFSVDRVRPLVQTYLGGLSSLGRGESYRDVGIRPPTGIIERVVRRGVEPRSQTQIVFSGPLVYRREVDHLLDTAAEVLQIRLRERLREDLGGTYDVRVVGTAEREPAGSYSFRIGFGAAPDRLEELVVVVFDEIRTLGEGAGPIDELPRVREMQRRSRETNIKVNGYWLSRIIEWERSARDLRTVLDADHLVESVTDQMIRDAVRQYVRSDNYVRVSLYPERS